MPGGECQRRGRHSEQRIKQRGLPLRHPLCIVTTVMPRTTALTAKPLPLAERKARLARMVKDGEISKERAALIDFREPTAKERAFAETLVPLARRFLAGRHAKAA